MPLASLDAGGIYISELVFVDVSSSQMSSYNKCI